MSLSRSTYDVVKAAEDLYGLIEYFPHVKRGRKKKSNGEKQDEQAGEESGDQAEQDAGAGPITMQSDALDALKTKR
jgi:hypothetical protein